MLSVPKRYVVDTGEGLPTVSPTGVRISALKGQISDRVNDASWPYTRRLLQTKRAYKNRFSPERLERLDRMIEAANATMYSKLANCVLDLKKHDNKDVKKKRGWTESEWKKHMDYISQIAAPKKDFRPPPLKRGPRKPIEALLPRLNEISVPPQFKMYKRLSQESNYRNPVKVSDAIHYNMYPNFDCAGTS
ncbi:unnamed protein product [Parnassius apollo]|uniref:(apollo) hypothetical protein n=1 Tax=Parnassius apollo TaxID=110799 RepID=A0A8S3XC14_PARAO|nr:unnamed protein product [Parnassius apollo]